MNEETVKEVQEVATEVNKEIVVEKPYTLRRLQARDLFTMTTLLSHLDLNEVKKYIPEDMFNDEEKDGEEKDYFKLGYESILGIVNFLLENLEKIEKDIYRLLSKLSGMEEKAIEELDIDIFMSMIVDVVSGDNFMGFIKQASRLFK